MPSEPPPTRRAPKITRRRRASDAPTIRISPSRIADIAAGKTEEAFAKHWKHIGGVRKVPVQLLEPAKLKALELGPREGFVLSLIDGLATVQVILDACGLLREDAVAILYELSVAGVIGFR